MSSASRSTRRWRSWPRWGRGCAAPPASPHAYSARSAALASTSWRSRRARASSTSRSSSSSPSATRPCAPSTRSSTAARPEVALGRGWGELLAQDRRDLGTEQFGGVQELRMWHRRGVHLERDARDTAERLAVAQDLLGHFLRFAEEPRALR